MTHGEWNKAQKLVVAGAIAPTMRKASTRRVKVIDRETGEVKREAVLAEVLEGLAKAHGLEMDVVCPAATRRGRKGRRGSVKSARRPLGLRPSATPQWRRFESAWRVTTAWRARQPSRASRVRK